jgi:hypothetical protein
MPCPHRPGLAIAPQLGPCHDPTAPAWPSLRSLAPAMPPLCKESFGHLTPWGVETLAANSGDLVSKFFRPLFFDTNGLGMSETEKKRRGRPGSYERPFAELAEVYGVKLRSVKRWAHVGKENGDPCPLEDPSAMPSWWERNMKHRVPEEIWALAGGAKTPKPPPVPVAVAEVAPELPLTADMPVPEGRGVEAELRRLEDLTARLSVNAHEPGRAKAYTDAVSKMGILTSKLREEAEKQRRLLPRDAVESAIHEFHGPIEREIRLLYRSFCELTGLPATPEMEEKWHRLVDTTFVRMAEEVLT